MSGWVDLTFGVDSDVSAVVGPGGRLAGYPYQDRGEWKVPVERAGEFEYLSFNQFVRQSFRAARAASGVEPFGDHHELLAWIPESKRREVLEMEAHVQDVTVGRTAAPGVPVGPYDAQTTTHTERRAAKVAELKISQATMTRRLRDYAESGVLGLIPHANRLLQASGALDVPPEILAAIRELVASLMLDSRKDLTASYALAVATLREKGLASVHEGNAAGLPCVEDVLPFVKFKRMVRHLNGGRIPRTAKTRQQQANRPPVADRRHRAYDFGDVIEMDSTPLDVLVRGANGPVKAHAVFAICVSTRYVWVRVVAGAPRGRDLALLVWDMAGGESALVPGSDVGADSIPNLPRRTVSVNAWRNKARPPAFLPGCVVLDHGAEEENGRFIRYLAQLGIVVRWARTRNPADKAFVESFISEFSRVCQLILGHKGNTVENRFATDPSLDDLPTIEMLHAAVRAWQQMHVNRPHTGLPHPHRPGHFFTPMEAVCSSLTRGVALRGFDDATRALGLLEHKRLTPQDDGITIGRRRYTGPGYDEVLRASLARTGRRSPVTFYFDPNRPGRLYWPIPGKFDVHVFTTPEENPDVVMPFADIRDDWLRAVQGVKEPSGHGRAMERARLLVAMNEAMADARGEATGRAKNGHVPGGNIVALRPSALGQKPSARRPSFGWDLTGDADLLADGAGLEEE